MRVRVVCLLLVSAVGCESVRPAAPAPVSQSAPLRSAPAAVEVLRASASQPAPVRLSKPPAEDDDPLARLAERLQRDDIPGAVLHLDTYVRAHPEQSLFRLQLAELCLRCDRAAEAKFNYERFIADAETGPAALHPHLVTAHIKLMEIAQRRNDRFGELFHRGAGLLLLVKEQDADKGRDESFCEEMLCKALKALQDAKELKPTEPRVRAFLADAYERTGNRRAAGAERAAVRESVTGAGVRLPLE